MAQLGRYSSPDVIRSKNLIPKAGKPVILPDLLSSTHIHEEWVSKLEDPAVPKVIDLFCGAGGMSEGFVQEGFIIAGAVDHEKSACDTYAANISANVICDDISNIPNPSSIIEKYPVSSISVIVGGPPCQGFSIGGRARIKSLAEQEQIRLLARNELYQQYFRFVDAFQPLIFIMENVPTLLSFENGAYINAIEKESERLGYALDYTVIDAAEYGVPQRRRRLIIVGSRIGKLFRWPRKLHENDQITLQNAIGDLPSILPPSEIECLPYSSERAISEYQQLMRSRVLKAERNIIYDHIIRPVREDDKEIFTHMKPGDRYIDIDPQYRRYDDKKFKDKYYMLKPDAPGVTITAHLAKDGYRYIHWDTSQYRTISVREAARIQSFGDHFRFTGSRSARFRQIGNAVPPLMASKLAQQVNLAIKRDSGAIPKGTIQAAFPGLEHLSHLVNTPE